MMLMSFWYRHAITCPECQQTVAVNHMRPIMRCSHCMATTNLIERGLAWWTTQPMCDYNTALLFRIPEGPPDGGIDSGGLHIEACRGPADCPSCHQPLVAAALAAAASAGRFTCACGYACSCRPAEPSLVERVPYACWLLGEAPSDSETPAAGQPILVACLSCGAGLEVDGSSRLVKCVYCNAPNYLPDGLWASLHPQPRMEWYRLVIDIDDATLATEKTRPLHMD